MTTRARVQAYGRQGYVTVTPEATYGATIGANVFNPDGSLFVPETAATPAGDDAVIVWRFIEEIPANVQAVAALASDGFVRRSGSSWTASAIVNADLAAADTDGLDEGAVNRYFTDERAQDAIGAAIAAGTGDGAALSYNDAGNAVGVTNTDKGSAAVTAHVAAGGAAHAAAVASGDSGFMSGADKAKLDGVAPGATANSTDAQLRDRATHTGTQLAATVSDFTAAARAAAVADALADGVTNVAPSQNAVVDALALKVAPPKGYIDGLQMQWVSGTALTVSSGAAYIEASANVVESPSAIAKSSLSLSASTWYHVYFYLNAGTPDVEIVTTAPVAYNGTARSKTGDSARRYLGSVRTDAAGSIYNFQQAGNYIGYKHDHGSAPFRVLSGGTATVETTVSLAAVVPVTSRMAQLYLINVSNHLMGTGTPDDSAGGPPFAAIALIAEQLRIIVTHPTDGSQQVTYWLASLGTPLSGSAFLDVYGYHFER